MKLPRLLSLFYLLPALFLLSCGSVKEPDFKGIENVRVAKFGLNASTLTFDLRYFNPNKSRLKLKNAEGEAWIDNNFLGHFIIDTLVHIPAEGEFRLPLKLQLDMSKMIKNSLVTFLAKEVTIKVDGRARVGKGFLFINYPILYEGKQNLRDLLK